MNTQDATPAMPKLEYWMLNIASTAVADEISAYLTKSGFAQEMRAILKKFGADAANKHLAEHRDNPMTYLGKLHATHTRIEEIKEFITKHAQQSSNGEESIADQVRPATTSTEENSAGQQG